ncbi:WAP type 'four disulfide core' [Trichuris trichiura]|uniref:WAP type 'four disulfide core n=1 Tax=Trichuris trichiura TaxID=36087 RepID=A0A077Z2J1_TRITR|nr:WAP type 'four disulfide core' [Trichuris trichiura]
MLFSVQLFVFCLLASSRPTIARSKVDNSGDSDFLTLHDSPKLLNVQVNQGESRSVDFLLVQPTSSFRAVVTPCGCDVEWALYRRVAVAPKSYRYYLPENTVDNRLYGNKVRQDLTVREEELTRHIGSNQMSYSTNSFSGRMGRIVLKSVTNRPCVSQIRLAIKEKHSLAQLLPNRGVRVRQSADDGSVTIYWDQLESEAAIADLEYIFLLSRSKTFEALCAADEQTMRFSISSSRRRTLTLSGLLTDVRYFLSVFAFRPSTIETVPFDSAAFTTTNPLSYPSSTIVDGQLTIAHLGLSQYSARIHVLTVEKPASSLLITLYPCTGSLRVSAYSNGQFLRHWQVEELKTVELTNMTAGELRIRVFNNDDTEKTYKLWASVNASTYPYPTMPFDTSLLVLEHGRTCRSVRLGWLESTQAHSVCLFKRREQDDYFTQLILLEEPNRCQGPAADSELVFCRRFHHHSGGEGAEVMITREVMGLRPANTYRFDLYASKPNGETLPYRTVWVKTKQFC